MDLLHFILILGTIHSGDLFDIRDAFKINWRFHGGHIPHEEESISENKLLKLSSTTKLNQENAHHDGHWIPPKLKFGVNFGIVGGKWPFFWSWKQKHHVAEHDTDTKVHSTSSNPSIVHLSESPAISSHPNLHRTSQISIKSKVPQLESGTTGVPLSAFLSQNSLSMNHQAPPHRLNSHAERIIRNFGIPQNHVVQTPSNNVHTYHSQSLSSFENPNLHNYHHIQHNQQHDSLATAPGNIFPTGGNSFTQPYYSHQRMQSLPEIIQPSSTNNLPVAKSLLPIISHPNNLKYSTIYSTQPKLSQNVVLPSESKHLTSLASVNYPNTNCYNNCYIPYTRGSLAHALVNDIQNLPISEDNKLVKALQVILAIAQDEARQQRRDLFEEQRFMRKR